MKFLPVDHPKVSATIERVVEHLVVNGFLQRFVASQVPTPGSLPLGEEEGGFLMCSFWLAQVHAMRGEIDEAEAILRRAEAIAGPVGLFAEGVDARNNSFLGNMPLLFSQVEYAKAAIALEERRGK
jgi:GH15 family glucan-1,4-alpha-glucosidase